MKGTEILLPLQRAAGRCKAVWKGKLLIALEQASERIWKETSRRVRWAPLSENVLRDTERGRPETDGNKSGTVEADGFHLFYRR